MFKRPQMVALGLVVLLLLIIWTLPAKTMAGLRLAIGSVFVPLIGVSSTGQHVSSQAGDALTPRGELLKQNDQLRRENQQLKLLESHTQEVERENARLRESVGWKQQKKWNVKLGRVVLREPSNWWRTFHIDLGSLDGMTNDLPVLTEQGLAGRIAAVSLTRSQVVLLGDSHCKVSALIQGESKDRLTGIVGPYGLLDTSLVALDFLPPNANVKSGNTVVTSGTGGIFPAGIMIGTVVDSHPTDYGLATQARVKLAVNLNALEEVWVLLK